MHLAFGTNDIGDVLARGYSFAVFGKVGFRGSKGTTTSDDAKGTNDAAFTFGISALITSDLAKGYIFDVFRSTSIRGLRDSNSP